MDGYASDTEVSSRVTVRKRTLSMPQPMVISGSDHAVIPQDQNASKKKGPAKHLLNPELPEDWEGTLDELKALRTDMGDDDEDDAGAAPKADKTMKKKADSKADSKADDADDDDDGNDSDVDDDDDNGSDTDSDSDDDDDDVDDDDGSDSEKEIEEEEDDDDEHEDDDEDGEAAPPVMKRRLGSAVPLLSRVDIEREEEEGEEEEEEDQAVVAARAQQAHMQQLQQQYTQARPENQWVDRLNQMGSVDSLRQLKVGNKTALDRAAEAALEARNKIRESFNFNKTTGAKTQRGKREEFAHKKELYDSIEAQQWRAARERGQQSFRGKELFGLAHPAGHQAQPQAVAPAAFTAGQLSDIKNMQDCSVDFMNYTDDAAFIKYFSTNYPLLETFAGLEKAMEGHDPEEDIPNLGKVKEVTEKAAKYRKVLDFYRSKMDIISSPFYMVLKQEDLWVKLNDLAQRIMSCRETRPELAEYLEAVYRLKVLESQGVVRDFEGAGLKRIERAGGMDKKHRRYIAFGTYENSVKTELSAGFSGESWQGEYTGAYLGDSKYKDDPHKWGKYGFKAKASYEGRVRAVEGGFSLDGDLTEDKKSKAKLSGSFSVGEAYVRGSAGATLALDQKDLFDGYFGVDAEMGASAVKGKITGSLGRNKKVLGEDVTAIGGEVDANVSLLEGRAALFGKAGRFKLHDTITDQDEVHEGVAIGVDAHAALVSGSIRGSLVIFGVKIGVKATGEVGAAGINAGFYATSKKVGLSFGAMLGLGGKLDLDVDFSYWTERFNKWLLKKSVEAGHNPLDLGMKKYERDKYKP